MRPEDVETHIEALKAPMKVGGMGTFNIKLYQGDDVKERVDIRGAGFKPSEIGTFA